MTAPLLIGSGASPTSWSFFAQAQDGTAPRASFTGVSAVGLSFRAEASDLAGNRAASPPARARELLALTRFGNDGGPLQAVDSTQTGPFQPSAERMRFGLTETVWTSLSELWVRIKVFYRTGQVTRCFWCACAAIQGATNPTVDAG